MLDVSKRTAIILLGAIALVISGCEIPQIGGEGDHGTLRLNVGWQDSEVGSLFVPGTSMDPDSYHVSGSGPNGASFEKTTNGGVLEVEHVPEGEWEIEVTAVNSEGQEIGYGVETPEVVRNEVTPVEVVVRPLEGTGSLSLTASWNEADVDNPQIAASLESASGQSSNLEFVYNGNGTASYSSDEVEGGYYTLSVQLLDGDHTLAGAVETVRILHGATTEGHFNFDDLNDPTGSVEIIVVTDLDEPLEVSLSGALAELNYGSTMTVEASVANPGDSTITYVWYVNGQTISAENPVTVGETLSPGNYRLDVVATTDEGQRSGSASHDFTVQ